MYGLGVMGQNLALNIASKGFKVSVHNRSPGRVDDCLERAEKEGLTESVVGFKEAEAFINSLKKPRSLILLVQAGPAVDASIATLSAFMEEGDILIDGGNEWFPNSIRRSEELTARGINFVGMGVSGGEEGARYGPSLMPGGPREAYDAIEPVLQKIAAQTDSGPCVTWVGEIGAGNHVKMVHNGIEYGDMQLIAEAYDILKTLGGLTNDELAATFEEWNNGELDSFLIEITYKIFQRKDDQEGKEGYLVDQILDKTGNKGTGKMTIKEGAERGIACPTMSAALDARFISALKDERVAASSVLTGPTDLPQVDRAQLVEDVRRALYAAKICSYAQGMNLIREAAKQNGWSVNLGECARIWKGGCIIRAKFLDRIKSAYDRNPDLKSLLVDPEFAAEINSRQSSWRRVATLCMASGISAPSLCSSLNYFDSYRRARLPANLTQAQRDFFGAHTFQRLDGGDEFFHAIWEPAAQDTEAKAE
jgi:6-phosphogluconate dehydrogenase